MIYIHVSYTLEYLITTDSAVEQKQNGKPWKDIQIPCRNWIPFDIDDFNNNIVSNQQLLTDEKNIIQCNIWNITNVSYPSNSLT